MRSQNALIVFAKSPEHGDVKTRLMKALSDDERIELYESLLTETVEKLRDVRGCETFIAYWPPEGGEYFERFGLRCFQQSGDGLGPRMHNAILKVLSEGFGKAVLVGVDIPGLSAGVVLDACELLEGCDAVFGPASDGGYYLVGMRRAREDVFEGIEWSTPMVLEQTLLKAQALGLGVGLTAILDDVDVPADLGGLSP